MRKLHFFSTLVALFFATTSLWAVPTGALPHAFTIGECGKQVYFSKGNLQYIGSAATPYWKFADHQYDRIGTSQNSSSQNVTRDLFGWGTKTNPWNTSTNSDDYSWDEWGDNAISNGGNTPNSGWRTLTASEWGFVMGNSGGSRTTTASTNYVKTFATVNGVPGLILLPDDWQLPAGLSMAGTNDFSVNNYTVVQWQTLENAGAVFLPAAGYRNGTDVYTGGLMCLAYIVLRLYKNLTQLWSDL